MQETDIKVKVKVF